MNDINNKLKLIHLHFILLNKTQNLNFFESLIYTFTWGFLGFYKHYLLKE